ncbi:hypothetical protein H4O18_21175 [Arenibacter sp. BSSL-BM3]|uniref:Uncharacterized protein n=2 Tax=Arenibacter arenosicollis TaxID=2762274 RepID=A0ABR7QU65_9FLAO|nr:hypothetical protein [Arenibacter arenosicollis]
MNLLMTVPGYKRSEVQRDTGNNHAIGVHSMTVPGYKRGAVQRDTGIDHAIGVPFCRIWNKKKVPPSCDEGTSKKGGGLLVTSLILQA